MNNIINFNKIRKIIEDTFMVDISKDKKIQIEEIVTNLLRRYRSYALSSTIDIVSIVKHDNFLVQSADLPIETTGYLAVNDNEPVDDNGRYNRLIVVNNKFKNPDNEENVILKKSRFITAHEYGHYILHKSHDEPLYAHRDSDKRDTPQELEADYFARSILMPKNIFLYINKIIDRTNAEIADTNGDMSEESFNILKLEFLSKYFKVTRNKVSKRLGDIDILLSMNN